MIVLSNRTHFSGWLQLLNNFNTISTEKFLSEKILCLLLLSEMLWWAKSWYFLAIKHIFLDGHNCWTTSTKFSWKIFVRKHFVPLLFVWNVLPSSKITIFGDKIYFTGWSRLLKIFIEIATLQSRPQFLSR